MCLPGPSVTSTFNDMARKFLNYVLNHRHSAKVIHIVFDRYFDLSPKSATRNKRGENVIKYHMHLNASVPQNWDQFLNCAENKGSLTKLYKDFICSNRKLIGGGIQIYIGKGRGDDVIMLKDQQDPVVVDQLKSDVEEADARLVLHAVYAGKNGAKNIVVSSPDTDVLVLLTHHQPHIKAKHIYIYTIIALIL